MTVFRFLLDANILSEPPKPEPNQKVLRRLAKDFNVSVTATVVYHELKFGQLIMPESRRKEDMADYIHESVKETLLILPYCEESAAWHAEERARLRKIGKTPPQMDGQIVAIAAVNNLILVTRNTKDFQYFQGLTVENWFE